MWYLIVSTPDLCTLTHLEFQQTKINFYMVDGSLNKSTNGITFLLMTYSVRISRVLNQILYEANKDKPLIKDFVFDVIMSLVFTCRRGGLLELV